ncbi:MAG: phenylacetate-CoA oxygenase subunit PaaC [Fluviicola sp.]|jgi:ring-1,2-phenylacetyl-CoA epoxidase subunit PaaC|nr:phenylacetate-CoA oxygenase subunit PaaC [Fluviicola sp.]
METKLKYYLQIADNALILSHRLSEYCSRAPFLEEDLANTNVALDLIGLAESVLEEVAKQEGKGECGDDLAYRRKESEFLNVILVEQPNEDFAHIMVRQFFTDAFNYYFFSELCTSKDQFLSALAKKSIKEITYHLRRSSEWMIRLGKGTPEASQKTQFAIDKLWKYTHEFFIENTIDTEMISKGIGANLASVHLNWKQKISEIFYMAHFAIPTNDFVIKGGKEGVHSENLGYILCEMQYLPSKYPDAKW